MSEQLITERSTGVTIQGGEIPPEVSVVMPCLNESRTLETCIRKAQRWFERSGVCGEIVIGDNGSTDGSQEIARRCGARVVDVPMRGYGAALFHASTAALGRYIVMGDSDDSYDFGNLTPFVEKLREGCDLVMGNRFAGGIKKGAMPWKNRYIGNPILTAIGRLFFRSPAHDLHCGLRGFSTKAFHLLDLRTTGMEYASEMVIKATLLGLHIAEVPTTLSPDGRVRAPHLRPWSDGWRHLRFMLLYSPRWLFLVPGMFLFIAGSCILAWLLPEPRRLLGVVLDVHTLIYAATAMLIGFQAVAFAAFSKVFAIAEGLLPPDRTLDRIFRYITLEVGLLFGFVLVLAGIGGSIASVLYWSARSFGPLDPARVLRAVIPSALAIALGTQVIFASFFMSVLGLRIRRTN
jgi:glycosyltransferase involved in cell wall biosynthesis